MLRTTKVLRDWLRPDRFDPQSIATFKIAVKTGVAALLTEIAAQLMGLSSTTWAVVSAVIVMQANLGSSLNASTQRLVGTAVGAAIGALLCSLTGQNAVVLGFGTTVTILACALLKIYESFRIATVTLTIVVLAGSASPWLFGLERFVDVTLGIAVALVVTVGLWPSRARRELYLTLAEVFEQDARLFRFVADIHLGQSPELVAAAEARTAIRGGLAHAQALLADIGRELPGPQEPLIASLLTATERLQADLLALDRQPPGGDEEALYLHLKSELENLRDEIIASFENLAAALRQEKSAAPRPERQQASQALAERLNELRRDRVTTDYSIESLLRFTSFVYRLQELTRQLDRVPTPTTESRGFLSKFFKPGGNSKHPGY